MKAAARGARRRGRPSPAIFSFHLLLLAQKTKLSKEATGIYFSGFAPRLTLVYILVIIA